MKANPDLGESGSNDSQESGLLRRVATRDRPAFDALYRLYWPRLTRFLTQLTHRPHLVEELVNDTLLVVWRKAGEFEGKARVSTWVFAIAYRKALKALKRREPFVEVAITEEPPGSDDPERDAMQAQRSDELRRALATLPPEQRAVVELTYYHDCAYPEIAQILGCPVDTVKTRMFHARRKLRLLIDAP
jgi:RNA polymerase sigma-70 factor (ECF subfamily)